MASCKRHLAECKEGVCKPNAKFGVAESLVVRVPVRERFVDVDFPEAKPLCKVAGSPIFGVPHISHRDQTLPKVVVHVHDVLIIPLLFDPRREQGRDKTGATTHIVLHDAIQRKTRRACAAAASALLATRPPVTTTLTAHSTAPSRTRCVLRLDMHVSCHPGASASVWGVLGENYGGSAGRVTSSSDESLREVTGRDGHLRSGIASRRLWSSFLVCNYAHAPPPPVPHRGRIGAAIGAFTMTYHRCDVIRL